MKRLIKQIYSFVLLAGLISGCNGFLEVKPKGIIIPEKLADYEAILHSQAVTLVFPPELLYPTDDFYDVYDEANRSSAANAYYWREGLDPNELAPPAIWGGYYSAIYHNNVVIRKAPEAIDGSSQQKDQLVAEAKVNRASAYFHLLTAFSKAYNAATAGNDPGVPLMVNIDVTEGTPPRATVQEVMDVIVNDVKEALPHLPVTNKTNYRVSRQAAYGLLARVYLYQGRFDEAGANAELALDGNHGLLDLNDYQLPTAMPTQEISPEAVWMQGGSSYSFPAMMLYTEGLIALFDADDLRYTLFARSNLRGIYYQPPGSGQANFGITVPELYLTQAEVLARNGNTQAAIDTLNALRRMRIRQVAYADFEVVNQEEALQLVLDERRRELAFRGVRWMDMKRLDREGRMPDVVRTERATGEILATLPAGGKAYTFQIPARVQQFNPDMELNDR